MSVPIDAPVWRPLYCSTCGRFLGTTTQETGAFSIYCKPCRKWRDARLGEPLADHEIGYADDVPRRNNLRSMLIKK